jgi:lipopolysaccharide exporter
MRMSSTAAPLDGIHRRMLGSLGWNTLGLIAQMLAQLAATVVLARLLGPAAFGLAAMAWAVIAPTGVLVDGGLGQSLVQRERLRDEEIAFCFWAQFCLGLFFATVVCVASPWIGHFFAEAALEAMLVAYSSVLVLQGLSGTSLNLLRRSLAFGRLQLVLVSSFVAANLLIAVPLAVLGAGVWSLVAAAIGNAALQAAIGYAMTRHDLRLRLGSGHQRFVTMSPKYLVLSLVNVAGLMTIPRFVLGRSFGSSSLGLFDRAYSLIVAPLARAAAMVDGVLFASHARGLERGRFDHGELYLATVTGALLFSLPAAAFIGMNGLQIIRVLLGDQWIAAAELVAPLASLIPIFFLIQVTVPVLNGLGRPGIEIIVQLAVVAAFVAAVLVLPRNPVEVIWTLMAAHSFRAVCLMVCVARITGLPARGFLNASAPGAVVLAMLLLFDEVARGALPVSLAPTAQLAALLVGSGVVVLGAYVAWWKIFRPALIVRALGP